MATIIVFYYKDIVEKANSIVKGHFVVGIVFIRWLELVFKHILFFTFENLSCTLFKLSFRCWFAVQVTAMNEKVEHIATLKSKLPCVNSFPKRKFTWLTNEEIAAILVANEKHSEWFTRIRVQR